MSTPLWLVQDKTKSRTRNRFAAAPVFVVDNENDDHGRAGREDYSVAMTGGGSPSNGFLNTEQTASCGEGYTGDEVVVAAGEYGAANQAEADALALAAAEEGLTCVEDDIATLVLHADNEVFGLFRQANLGWIIGGLFTAVGQGAAGSYPTTRNRICRLDSAGVLDAAFNPNSSGFIFCINEQTDGKILVGGNFTTIAGATRRGLARLNADGTLDSAFPDLNPGTLGGSQIRLTSGGDILVCGAFTAMGGATHNRVAKISSAGAVDAAFTTDCNAHVYAMCVRADGKIVIGGDFTTVNGTARNRCALLNADGTLDATFNPNCDSTVRGLLELADGTILLGGDFTTVSATTRNHVAKVSATGTLDSGFNPNISTGSYADAFMEQSTGKIIMGGNFTAVAATTRNGICQLNADGTLNAAFATGVTAGGRVYTIFEQGNGRLMVGGAFSTLVGVGRNNFGRLNSDGTIA